MSAVLTPERTAPVRSLESRRADAVRWIAGLYDELTSFFGRLDGGGTFAEDRWERPGGGSGVTRVMTDGETFEKAGITRSAVVGVYSGTAAGATHFFATGVSLVVHPHSPMLPAVHLNVRYFELTDDAGQLTDSWYGGGTDLTPFYPHEDDAVLFHRALRTVCDRHHVRFYPEFKRTCDEVLVNTHRDNEARGIGGICFDHLQPSADNALTPEQIAAFVTDVARSLHLAYEPIVHKRRDEPFAASDREFQLVRRGRYVEFNLLHDRSTLLGLETDARVECVLMSLPPLAMWQYAPRYAAGSVEARLISMLVPRDWTSDGAGA